VSSPPGRRVVAAIADFLQLAAFLGTRVELRVGAFEIAKPLVLWINDGLMALFFFPCRP
jgi:Na+/H+ antiporter NhaA